MPVLRAHAAIPMEWVAVSGFSRFPGLVSAGRITLSPNV
jgi:hypothetical protein